MNVYLELNRAKAGPFTKDQIEIMYRSGAVHADTLAWAEGFSKWLPLKTVVQIETTPPSATAPPLPSSAETHPLIRYLLPVGRVGRGIWCLRVLAHLFGVAVLYAPFADSNSTAAGLWAFILGTAWIYLTVIHAAKRLHDLNVTGWLSPIIFVPIVPLLLLILSGSTSENRFGPATTNRFFA